MNILVVGLGSMGKRRIRLIQEMYPEYVIVGVDGREDRRNEAKKLFNIECVDSISGVDSKYNINAAFVCTSPLSHNVIIRECLKNKWNVFTEINLVADGYEDNMKLAKENNCVLFLSSTFFYREEICYIRNRIDKGSKWNYIYHIGQYLSDWHPWENYKDFFVGDERTNGCREIMAIEMPWLTKTFGDIEDVHVIADKMSNLKICYSDNYMIQLQHTNGNKGTLVIDVVSPVAVRKLDVYKENEYFQWGGTPDSLYEYDKINDQLKNVVLNEKEEHEKGYRTFIVENAYKNEIQDFFDVMNNDKEQVYGFEEDLKVLQIIDQVEKKAWKN